MHIRPLLLEVAVGVEYLDAVVLPVSNIHISISVCDDVMRDAELAGIGARRAP